jgi:hypothetical protein
MSQYHDPWHPWIGTWELDIYLGVAGFLFIVLCGIWLRFRGPEKGQVPRFRNMDWPIGITLFLSLGANFYVVVLANIPLVSSVERVPTRFIIVPILALVIIGCIRLQALLNTGSGGTALRIAGLAGLLHNTCMLSIHSWIWQNRKLERLFADPTMDNVGRIVSGENTFYEVTVVASLGLSLLGLGLWVFLWRRNRLPGDQDA